MVIYLTAPHACWETDRYEQYYYLVGNRYKGAQILEARELMHDAEDWRSRWPATLENIDALIFVRHEKLITGEMWAEIESAHHAGKEVYLACTINDGELLLTDYDDVKFQARKDGAWRCSIRQPAQEMVRA